MQNLNYQNVLGISASDEWFTTVLRVTFRCITRVRKKSCKAEKLIAK